MHTIKFDTQTGLKGEQNNMTYNYLVIALLLTVGYIGLILLANAMTICEIVGEALANAFTLDNQAMRKASFLFTQAIITSWIIWITILILASVFDVLVNFL